jgi:hypothetical protein
MSPTEATSFELGGYLSAEHAALIRASAISNAVRDERGYRTIDTPEELLELGFSPWQARQAPGLYLPSWRVDGSNGSGQFRPDSPTPDKKGNVRKYLAPTGARNVLDVHPTMTARLQDATAPLIITEGVRKADALTTLGQCAVAVSGVWNWKTRTEDDESITLQDFEEIRVSGRRVILMFDSDARSNANVRLALRRLADMLIARGAQVETILPPDGPNGEKQGIDDFLGAGGVWESLWSPENRLMSVGFDSWDPLNLSTLGEREQVLPDLARTLAVHYPGKRHVVSGPPESFKTMIEYAALLEALRNGKRVGIVNFEMDDFDARDMFRDLGATDDELASIVFISPERKPTDEDIKRV